MTSRNARPVGGMRQHSERNLVDSVDEALNDQEDMEEEEGFDDRQPASNKGWKKNYRRRHN